MQVREELVIVLSYTYSCAAYCIQFVRCAPASFLTNTHWLSLRYART